MQHLPRSACLVLLAALAVSGCRLASSTAEIDAPGERPRVGPFGGTPARPLARTLPVEVFFVRCPDDAPATNPDKLWLALDGSEVQVKLVPVEPVPF